MWTSVLNSPAPDLTAVLVTDGEQVLRAQWVPRFSLEQSSSEMMDGDYNPDNDEYYWPEGWYEWNRHEEIHWFIEEAVTYWMPLPPMPSNARAAIAKATGATSAADNV